MHPSRIAIHGGPAFLQAHPRTWHRTICKAERATDVQKSGSKALTPKPKLSSAAGKKDRQGRSTGVSGWMSSAALARLKTAPDASLEAAVARLGLALPDQGGSLLPASGEAAQRRRAEVAAAALSSPTFPAAGTTCPLPLLASLIVIEPCTLPCRGRRFDDCTSCD